MGRKKKTKQRNGKRDVQNRQQMTAAPSNILANCRNPVSDSLPIKYILPLLGIKNTTACNHGCEIVTKGSRAYNMLYYLITGLNAGVNGVLGTVEDARELCFQAKSFAEGSVEDLDKVWCGGLDSHVLATSLTSIGTDFLLMEGDFSRDAPLKVVTAIAGLVCKLQEINSTTITISEHIRKHIDILQSGKRDIVDFFNKRVGCGCLKNKCELLKETQKMGKCDQCLQSFEKNQLMMCSKCKFAQYCSRACQKSHWLKHKEMCNYYVLESFLSIRAANQLNAFIAKEESGTDESVDEIMRRLHLENFEKPSYRKKYGHIFDMDVIDQKIKELDVKAAGNDQE